MMPHATISGKFKFRYFLYYQIIPRFSTFFDKLLLIIFANKNSACNHMRCFDVSLY